MRGCCHVMEGYIRGLYGGRTLNKLNDPPPSIQKKKKEKKRKTGTGKLRQTGFGECTVNDSCTTPNQTLNYDLVCHQPKQTLL